LSDILDKLIEVKIGNYDDWINFSDHTPLIVEFELGDKKA